MALRTRIYIDGFNLYYGCLRQTPYKWLDLVALFERQTSLPCNTKLLRTARPSR